MHRRVRWAALALLIVAMGILWLRPRSAGRVRLNPDRELRVLAVSLRTNHVFSAEPLWKRAARGVLPVRWQGPLGSFRGQRLQTKHESLMVWIDEVHAPGTLPVELSSEALDAVMPDGSVARGVNRRPWLGFVAVEFAWFDRAAARVRLRVQDGTNLVTFFVDNPRPSRAASWPARKPPQTCEVARTEIALLGVLPGRRFGRFEEPADAVVHARALGEGRAGWMAWRMTAFDPIGNWSEGGWTYGTWTVRVPPLPEDAPYWKLLFEAQEYLSAGFVPSPTNGVFIVLPVSARARELGVRFVIFAGPGVFEVTNGAVSRVEGNRAGASGRHPVDFIGRPSGTNWAVELRASASGIFGFWEENGTASEIELRLRERVGDDKGHVLRTLRSSSVSASVDGTRRTAAFYEPRFPAVTTNLEVEIIATLPPAAFFVTPPGH